MEVSDKCVTNQQNSDDQVDSNRCNEVGYVDTTVAESDELKSVCGTTSSFLA